MLGLYGSVAGQGSVLRIGGDPAFVDLTTSNLATAIPTLYSGAKPKFLYVGSATSALQFHLGGSGVDSKLGPLLSAFAGAIFNAMGKTHFGASMLSGTFGDFCVTPIEPIVDLDGPPQIGHGSSSTSFNVNVGATKELAIPNRVDGSLARYVVVQSPHDTVCIKAGVAGETIHGPPIRGMRLMGHYPVVLNVMGSTKILCTSTFSNGRDVKITPVEV